MEYNCSFGKMYQIKEHRYASSIWKHKNMLQLKNEILGKYYYRKSAQN